MVHILTFQLHPGFSVFDKKKLRSIILSPGVPLQGHSILLFLKSFEKKLKTFTTTRMQIEKPNLPLKALNKSTV